jgi:uncharacterized protein (TIGR00255 family)
MTGYGEARHQSDALTLAVELRAVNNRYLKVTVRASEPYNLLEAEFEKVIRRTVRRGTILLHLRVDRQYQPHDFRINPVALRSYLEQVKRACEEGGLREHLPALLPQVLALPGVAAEPGAMARPADEEWPVVERVLEQALVALQQMRKDEGARMADELLSLRNHIGGQLQQIRDHLPSVSAAYRDRLHERVRNLLGDANVHLDPDDLIKEVAIFAERSDVAEEVVRLASHLEQFQDVVRTETDGPGRKLEFLTQEMFREANTIGSKAGDVTISRHVVEIKAALEKIRELVQNVE